MEQKDIIKILLKVVFYEAQQANINIVLCSLQSVFHITRN